VRTQFRERDIRLFLDGGSDEGRTVLQGTGRTVVTVGVEYAFPSPAAAATISQLSTSSPEIAAGDGPLGTVYLLWPWLGHACANLGK